MTFQGALEEVRFVGMFQVVLRAPGRLQPLVGHAALCLEHAGQGTQEPNISMPLDDFSKATYL